MENISIQRMSHKKISLSLWIKAKPEIRIELNYSQCSAMLAIPLSASLFLWLSENSTGIRSTTTLTESSLCEHVALKPACLLFSPLPFRFFSLQLTTESKAWSGTTRDGKKYKVSRSERASERCNNLRFSMRFQIDLMYKMCQIFKDKL